ncbi:MAG: serine acetyltransferase [Acidobacteriales bacterium]|nr:serine acetyltransferase [Terriglobales bacterium]
MFDNLRVDFERARGDRSRTLKMGGWDRSVLLSNIRILMALTTWSVISYRYSHWVVRNVRIPVVRQLFSFSAILLQRWTELWTGVFIHREAVIGPGLVVHTPYAICIGPTKIGENCTVGSGVVINGGSRGIGDNVYFGPGAKVVGTAKVGNNVVIVANSLVLTDVPDNRTVVGVPARIRLPGGRPQKFQKPAQLAPPPAAPATAPK